MTGDDRARWSREARSSIALPGSFRETAERAIEAMRFPESMPRHGRMVVTDDGGVWLERYRPFPGESPALWDVLGSDGRVRGGIELPAGFSPSQVGDSWVVGVAVDGLGVERVREYELAPP